MRRKEHFQGKQYIYIIDNTCCIIYVSIIFFGLHAAVESAVNAILSVAYRFVDIAVKPS